MRMKSIISSLAPLALAAGMAAAAALPAAAQSALDDIISRGKLIVGIDLNVAPFGYQDENQQPAGSEVETAKLLAKDLGVELEIVQVTAANRIPYLQTAKVDLMLATFAISPERAKAVWFSQPYGATGSVLLGNAADTITDYAGLAGKKVAVARGSFTEQALAEFAPPTAEVIRFDDDAAATTAFLSGQADAYGTAFPIAATIAKKYPDRNYAIKFPMLTAWYAIGMKRGDSDLLQWVNSFLFFHLQNGDLKKIYEEGVGLPLPPVPSL